MSYYEFLWSKLSWLSLELHMDRNYQLSKIQNCMDTIQNGWDKGLEATRSGPMEAYDNTLCCTNF